MLINVQLFFLCDFDDLGNVKAYEGMTNVQFEYVSVLCKSSSLSINIDMLEPLCTVKCF